MGRLRENQGDEVLGWYLGSLSRWSGFLYGSTSILTLWGLAHGINAAPCKGGACRMCFGPVTNPWMGRGGPVLVSWVGGCAPVNVERVKSCQLCSTLAVHIRAAVIGVPKEDIWSATHTRRMAPAWFPSFTSWRYTFSFCCSLLLIADWDGGLEDDSEDARVSRRPWHHCHWQWYYIPNRFFWASRGHAVPEGFRACSNTWHPPYLCGCQQWSQDWFGWGDSAHVPRSLGRPRWPIQGKEAQESEVKLCNSSQKNLIFTPPLLIEVRVNTC